VLRPSNHSSRESGLLSTRVLSRRWRVDSFATWLQLLLSRVDILDEVTEIISRNGVAATRMDARCILSLQQSEAESVDDVKFRISLKHLQLRSGRDILAGFDINIILMQRPH
jgi:hypothetical protein